MKKLLWKCYYLFVESKTGIEKIIRYCRINGKPYINLKLSKKEEDL